MTRAGLDATTADEDALRMIDGVSSAQPSHIASPPARFSAAAKAEWDTAPETLRAEVSRMEKEFLAGFAKYKIAAERDADLAGFHDRATKGGGTLKEVLSWYISLEDLLRSDPDKGLEAVFQNIGISSREWATKLLGQKADCTTEAVTKFAAAHPRFDELSEDIVFFLETGRADDLAEAYSLAERFNVASDTAVASSALGTAGEPFAGRPGPKQNQGTR
jgi:hypothetical protein